MLEIIFSVLWTENHDLLMESWYNERTERYKLVTVTMESICFVTTTAFGSYKITKQDDGGGQVGVNIYQLYGTTEC